MSLYASRLAVIEGYGAAIAFYQIVIRSILRQVPPGHYERARINLGRKLTLGLEFELGADILRTAIAPTLSRIGIVAAIIVLRTALNFFLERDIERLERRIGGAPT